MCVCKFNKFAKSNSSSLGMQECIYIRGMRIYIYTYVCMWVHTLSFKKRRKNDIRTTNRCSIFLFSWKKNTRLTSVIIKKSILKVFTLYFQFCPYITEAAPRSQICFFRPPFPFPRAFILFVKYRGGGKRL